jgi:hypothetical protein
MSMAPGERSAEQPPNSSTGSGVSDQAKALISLVVVISLAIWIVSVVFGEPRTGAEKVSADVFASRGLVWPFTVPGGTLGCVKGTPFFEANGKRYALNGIGRALYPYADDVLKVDEESWRLLRRGDPNGYVPKVQPGDALVEAQKLCVAE